MNSSRHTSQHEPGGGINLADIYFVIFRHKWKIVVLSLLGFVAAGVYYFTKQPPYQSEAELLIRYVTDSRAVNPVESNARVTSLDDLGESVINSEMKILSTWNLAAQVATNIGPERILAKIGGGNDATQAAGVIRSGLKIDPVHGSSVIDIIFHHPDPTIVQPVLNEIIAEYKEQHAYIHSAAGFSDDLLTEETAQLLQRINLTEEEIRIAKTNAGVISVADEQKAYSEENARIREELSKAEADLAERQAAYAMLSGQPAVAPSPATNGSSALSGSATNVPDGDMEKYKSVCLRLKFLEDQADDYLSKQGYTEDNKLVKENRARIAEITNVKTNLESKYPTLVPIETGPIASSQTNDTLAANPLAIVILQSRIKTLHQQLAGIQSDAASLDATQSKIDDLERKKVIEEQNYKVFADDLERSHINESMGPGKVNNIQTIQTPAPPYKDYGKFYKNVGTIAFSGILIGLGLAFLIEFVLDRSIKRPVEIQNKLKIPFFLSIPDLARQRRRVLASGRKQLAYQNSQKEATNGSPAGPLVKSSRAEITSWEINRQLQSYYDALRDRLVIYFESINLTRTPKLVAVTSTDHGAGVSTIAAGLAASLSETGDGRVLLVDMNVAQGAAQQFLMGQPGCKLDDALVSEKRDSARVQDNLYLVSEGDITDKLPRALPKRFASLIPKLKASDYDYIIFDMPPVSPTSVTTRLAGFMDTVLLVIESEKTDTQIVRQASDLLVQSKANVTAVLNKTHQYVPERLHRDFLSDAR